MTIYAGEYLRIGVTARKQDAPGQLTPILPEHITSATVTIWNTDSDRVAVNERPLQYDEDSDLWIYHWNTNGLPPGSYKVRATFVGLGVRRSWEEQSVVLRASNSPVLVVVPE